MSSLKTGLKECVIMAPRIGLIAVGGLGERLGESGRQKCLLELNGKPVFEHMADSFAACGVEQIIFLTGYFHEQVTRYLDNDSKASAGNWKVVYGGVEGEGRAVCSAKHLLCQDFLYADGNIVVSRQAIYGLVAMAESCPNAIGVSVLSKDKKIAPTHPRVLLGKQSNVISSVILPQDPAIEESDFFIVGLHYLRLDCISFIENLPPKRSLCDYITLATAAGRQAYGFVMKTPWFALHTPDDIQRWEESPIRSF